MTCFHPLKAYRLLTQKTEAGKSVIVFDSSKLTGPFEPIELPCSQCTGCRAARAKDWAIRCVHEASFHEHNCFITLTYDDEHIPEHGNLSKRDFQLFMKRLRKRFPEVKIRFYHCGEYGTKRLRPHYHACIFGFDFPDREFWDEREGVKLYRSAILEELWDKGYSTVGNVTYESAAYVARYVLKKINGKGKEAAYRKVNKETGEVTQLPQEYTTMSRRPGIGAEWFKQFKADVYPKDFVTHKGIILRPPRYYDKIYDIEDPEGFKNIKARRKQYAKKHKEDFSPDRLKAKKKILKQRLSKLVRSVEL